MPKSTASNVGIGHHSNPERYRQDNHWEAEEVEVDVAATDYDLGTSVAAGETLRIREITIRHEGTNNTVVTLLVGTTVKVTIDVTAQSTRVWSSQDGREFAAGEQPVVQTSDVTGGSTFVSAVGIEA